jgi:hypothetical protein
MKVEEVLQEESFIPIYTFCCASLRNKRTLCSCMADACAGRKALMHMYAKIISSVVNVSSIPAQLTHCMGNPT